MHACGIHTQYLREGDDEVSIASNRGGPSLLSITAAVMVTATRPGVHRAWSRGLLGGGREWPDDAHRGGASDQPEPVIRSESGLRPVPALSTEYESHATSIMKPKTLYCQ